MVTFVSVTLDNIDDYVRVGLQSYREHYLHLWENEDASAFVQNHLTVASVKRELKDPQQQFFLIKKQHLSVGILKLTLRSEEGKPFSSQNLLLNKIYLLKAYSGKGIGQKALLFTEDFARDHQLDLIWLYTMKKGRSLNFYTSNGYTILGEATIELPKVKAEESAMYILGKYL